MTHVCYTLQTYKHLTTTIRKNIHNLRDEWPNTRGFINTTSSPSLNREKQSRFNRCYRQTCLCCPQSTREFPHRQYTTRLYVGSWSSRNTKKFIYIFIYTLFIIRGVHMWDSHAKCVFLIVESIGVGAPRRLIVNTLSFVLIHICVRYTFATQWTIK